MRTYDVGDLSEGLVSCERGLLVFPLCQVHLVKLEWDVLLVTNDGDAQSASGRREAVELENHVGQQVGWSLDDCFNKMRKTTLILPCSAGMKMD